MNTIKLITIAVLVLMAACSKPTDELIVQNNISRIEGMPNHPEPYKMLNWQEKAINFDHLVFDWDATGDYRPFIWLDNSQRNNRPPTFGLYTVIGDVRQGPNANNGEFHEALTSLGALMSAGLVGIDKRNENGYNYVKMIQNYFNTTNGWNIVMNNTSPEVALLGGGYGRDWWYDVFPNVLYYAVCELHPDVEGAESIQRTIAEQFFKADSVLKGNYDYSYFDYSTMTGMRNNIVYQQDAAAGHAYVLYAAYQKFEDPRYLQGTKSAIEALLGQEESRFYEVLMPFGAYIAARLNAETGTDYEVQKMIDWTFDGCTASDGREGWGIISDRWGDYDVHGLQGSLIHNEGYGFLMSTFDMAWPLVAMVRYEPGYARAIGKWMLNASNAARLFYPFEIPDENQWLPDVKQITNNEIAYEGLSKSDLYEKEALKGASPVALGDGPNWVVSQPEISMFSIYGSAHVGIYGSIIRKTNVEQILQLDCLSTDFYREEAYPTYLYFNPYNTDKELEYSHSGAASDLFDALTGKVIAQNVAGVQTFTIKANEACLIVAIPAGSKINREEGKTYANGVVIAYN
jgi:hypothetical protein